MGERQFDAKPAKRERVPLLVGLMGPSGSGKTFSALRLATGMQRVTGGDIYVIDTESRRALHYADDFKFQHVQFDPPFSPLDYLKAIEYCVRKKAGVVVVDSMSHEHEGPGGVLEWHDTEADRLAKLWGVKRAKVEITAWNAPKTARRKLIQGILQLGIDAIFCFRAKEKLKITSGKDPVQLGWMPIAGDEFLYEMTVNCLLYPASGGVPEWNPGELGEKQMVKLPSMFQSLFAKKQPLSEEIGESLARWSEGDAKTKPSAPKAAPTPAGDEPNCDTVVEEILWQTSEEAVRAVAEKYKGFPWNEDERKAVKDAILRRCKELAT